MGVQPALPGSSCHYSIGVLMFQENNSRALTHSHSKGEVQFNARLPQCLITKTINITRVRCQDDVDGRGLHSTEHYPCILKVLPRFPDRMGIWSKLDMIKQKKKKKKKKGGKNIKNY